MLDLEINGLDLGALGEQNKKDKVLTLDIADIESDPNQPRRVFDAEELQELADSIARQGLIQPIVVTPIEGADANPHYRIVTGERRWRACQKSGLKTVRAILGKYEEQTKYAVQMAENVYRSNLRLFEICQAIMRRMETGASQKEIAQELGLSKGSVSQYCAYKDAPACIKKAVDDEQVTDILVMWSLFSAYADFPQKTEEFLQQNIKVNRAQTKAFINELRNPTPGVSEDAENTLPATDAAQPSTANPFADDGTDDSEEKAQAAGGAETEEGMDFLKEVDAEQNFSSDSTEDGEHKKTNFSVSGDERPDPEISAQEREEKSETEDAFQGSTGSISGDDFLAEEGKSAVFKKPLVLARHDGRDCEVLVHQRPANEGFFVIRYEDGTTAEVLGETIALNRVIEG